MYSLTKLRKGQTANSLFSHLRCAECGQTYDKNQINLFCNNDDCNNPLVAIYDFQDVPDKNLLKGRVANMWRYKEVLPVLQEENIVSLGEGMTPLVPTNNLAKKLDLKQVFIKDESNNPTGSFKARGLSMAISKAKELGITKCTIPTAGNAGSAMSAYCAKAGMRAFVYMPKNTPELFKTECRFYGAELTQVAGTISDCARIMKMENTVHQAYDVSTLKEPYRLEGKKTMGYEIAEQLAWQTPDVIVYPTGGGTGLIGIWKAFQEMLQMAWISEIKTRMVAVQVDNCCPIVEAFEKNQTFANPYNKAGKTIANGLRVPHAFGHRLILRALKDSNGTAIKISDQEMMEGIEELAKLEGLFVAPEGAAVWAALKQLRENDWVKADESVVLLNTGSAYKYMDNILGYKK